MKTKYEKMTIEILYSLYTFSRVVGSSPNVSEKNQQGRFRRIRKTLFGTDAINEVKLISVIPF